VLLYGMTACAHYLALEFERARRLETRELELKLLAQDAELRMLRTQIDPHFLFNSLNSISALTSIDADAARDMTLQLAGFFRHTLGLEAHRKVLLSDEVELTQRFLAIEQVRFGPRLAFACEMADDAARCLLPPMILQPLVENAVKHGIGQLPQGGVVRVHAVRAGSQLKLRVENDVDPDGGPAGKGGGVGLANVRQRLHAAYGIDASVHATREGATFRVDLILPADMGD
jgi:two-component system sensor histidine kinase AlgZ